MTREDIIRMAQESGLVDRVRLGSEAGCELSLRKMQAFAELAAAAERKECADLCDEVGYDGTGHGCAELIRMRGGDQRCAACGYQHGHAIGCVNNPVDIALSARGAP